MEICFNCGSEVPDGASYCNNCGNNPQVMKEDGPGSKLETPEPELMRKSGPVGMGYSKGSVQSAQDKAWRKKREEERKLKEKERQQNRAGRKSGRPAGMRPQGTKEKPAAAKKAASSPAAPQALPRREQPQQSVLEMEIPAQEAAIPPGPDTFQNQITTERIARTCLLIGTMLLLPAIVLPWFYFTEGVPVEAYRVPVAYLFTNSFTLPALSAGAALTVFFFTGFLISMSRRPPATFVQVFAFGAILLTVGGLLIGFRQWNALQSMGAGYADFAREQEEKLPDVRVFGPVRGDTMLRDVAPPAGLNASSPVVFFRKTLGSGALFPLVAGLFLLWASGRYAPYYESFQLRLSPVLAALAATILIFAFALFLVSRLAPAWMYTTQAGLYMRLDKLEQAETVLEKCAALPAPDGSCQITLAGIYWKTGRVDEARNLLRKVVEKKPGYAAGHSTLGDLYFAETNYLGAMQEYRKYVELVPGSRKYAGKLSETMLYIGNQKYGDEDYENALEYFEGAIDLLEANRSDPALQYKIGDCYYRQGNKEKALEHFQASADLRTDEFEPQIQVAKICEELGDFDKAMIYYKKSIDAKPDNSFSYVYIGNLYRDVWKDYGKAAEWYEKGIEASIHSNGAHTAERNLEELRNQGKI